MEPQEPSRPRDAASVILVRERSDGGALEVFLLRRHRGASFMSSAFVFPGGASEPDETDLRLTAARELFEEAGVLLADRPIDREVRERWRAALHAGASFPALLAEAGASVDVEALDYFAHWITPSIEKKRFSARFYVAALPPGQTPSFDNRETVDEIWLSPDEALERAGELLLPPPQVRTLLDLRAAARAGLSALRGEARRRSLSPFPILPRLAPTDSGFALLLPWDPEYETRGTGESMPMPAGHPLAVGPSRFVLEDGAWRNVEAPVR